jgi:GT2 family glycosyltransferase
MAAVAHKKVTVVVPVYGDWPSLAECIDALKQHVDPRHRVMLVNDCGPDVELIEKNIKRAIKGTNFLYFRNPRNLGFVGNCNHAVMELDKTTNDILLLNSDTKVTSGFLEEMLEVLYAADNHGAVSPRSNNATIGTIPLSTAGKGGIEPAKSYQLFQRLKIRLPRYTEVPLAHGFCMLTRRSLIKKYGLFDPAFGKGYGEEVDYCQRIAAHGYKSILCNRAYVFHLEARSFSMEKKSKLLEANNQIIWKRYPNYRQSVRDYMSEAIPHEDELLAAGRFSPKLTVKKLLKRNPAAYNLARKLAKKTRII